jgi:hypothetical protein
MVIITSKRWLVSSKAVTEFALLYAIDKRGAIAMVMMVGQISRLFQSYSVLRPNWSDMFVSATKM